MGVVTRPLSTLRSLSSHPRGVRWSAYAVAMLCLLYSLTVAGLHSIGVSATVQPWLRIPAEEYYFWEVYLIFPVYFGCWILAAGFVQLVSRSVGGQGSFEGNLATLGFVIVIPWLLTWLVETAGLIMISLNLFTLQQWQWVIGEHPLGKVFIIAYQLLAILWQVILVPLAVHASQGLSPLRSILLAVVTLAIVGVTAFVFIR